jgi:hypothetical protein
MGEIESNTDESYPDNLLISFGMSISSVCGGFITATAFSEPDRSQTDNHIPNPQKIGDCWTNFSSSHKMSADFLTMHQSLPDPRNSDQQVIVLKFMSYSTFERSNT